MQLRFVKSGNIVKQCLQMNCFGLNLPNSLVVHVQRSTMITGETILLGKPSLRQVRVRPRSCPIPAPMQPVMGDCQGTYGEGTRTSDSYGPEDQWVYRSAQQLMRYCKWGMFYKYGGDGYTVDLNSTR